MKARQSESERELHCNLNHYPFRLLQRCFFSNFPLIFTIFPLSLSCSGGKDSIFNLVQCACRGHELVCLANLQTPPDHESIEMDSYMYQTVGSNLVPKIAECMQLPLVQREITGRPKMLQTFLSNSSLCLPSNQEQVR